MKILFLANDFPLPVRNGSTQRTFNIIKRLSRSCDLYLLCFYHSDKYPMDKDICKLRNICRQVKIVKSPVYNNKFSVYISLLFSIFTSKPYMIWRHKSKEFLSELNKIVYQNTFDLIHYDMLPLSQYKIKNIKSKTTLTYHDVSYLKFDRIAETNKNFFIKTVSRLESFKLKFYEREICRNFDLNIMVSNNDREKLLEITKENPKNLYVVQNGVDLNDRYIKKSFGKRKLLWIGGLDYLPNYDAIDYFLKRIYPLIRDKISIQIDIIGKIKNIQIVDQNRGHSDVVFHGFVKNLQPYIDDANLFIVPIRSGGGTRLKILEAMSWGMTVITTSIGCEGINGQNKKHYIIADDPKNFADEIISTIDNRKLQKIIGENARIFVENKYNYDRIVENMHIKYKQLVSGQSL